MAKPAGVDPPDLGTLAGHSAEPEETIHRVIDVPALGDIVRLKTGGPAMTVCGRGKTSDEVMCVWFQRLGRSSEWAGPTCESFHTKALVVAEKDV